MNAIAILPAAQPPAPATSSAAQLPATSSLATASSHGHSFAQLLAAHQPAPPSLTRSNPSHTQTDTPRAPQPGISPSNLQVPSVPVEQSAPAPAGAKDTDGKPANSAPKGSILLDALSAALSVAIPFAPALPISSVINSASSANPPEAQTTPQIVSAAPVDTSNSSQDALAQAPSPQPVPAATSASISLQEEFPAPEISTTTLPPLLSVPQSTTHLSSDTQLSNRPPQAEQSKSTNATSPLFQAAEASIPHTPLDLNLPHSQGAASHNFLDKAAPIPHAAREVSTEHLPLSETFSVPDTKASTSLPTQTPTATDNSRTHSYESSQLPPELQTLSSAATTPSILHPNLFSRLYGPPSPNPDPHPVASEKPSGSATGNGQDNAQLPATNLASAAQKGNAAPTDFSAQFAQATAVSVTPPAAAGAPAAPPLQAVAAGPDQGAPHADQRNASPESARSSAPLPDPDGAAAPLPGASPSINSAQLTTASNHAEMKIALQADQLGAIELHARVSGEQVGAAILVEKREAHAALAVELPSLQQALSEKQLRVNEIALLHHALQSTAGDSANAGAEQRRNFMGNAPSPSIRFSEEGQTRSGPGIPAVHESGGIFNSSGRLSVHA